MQADIGSSVVMDIAAFKVSHSAGFDRDATALQAASSKQSVQQGWRKCLGKGRRPAYRSRFVRIHVGVGQCGRAADEESCAL